MRTSLIDKYVLLLFTAISLLLLAVILVLYFSAVGYAGSRQNTENSIRALHAQHVLVERYTRFNINTLNENALAKHEVPPELFSIIEQNHNVLMNGGNITSLQGKGSYSVAAMQNKKVSELLQQAHDKLVEFKELTQSSDVPSSNYYEKQHEISNLYDQVELMVEQELTNRLNLPGKLELSIFLCVASFLVMMSYIFYLMNRMQYNAQRRLHEAEKVQANSETFVQQILNALPDPIFVKNSQHQWVNGNAAFWDMMGGNKDEFLGKNDRDIFPEDQALVFFDKDEYVIKNKIVDINEERITKGDGSTIIAVTKKVPLQLPDGGDGLVGIISDVTEAKLAERRLTAMNNRLQELINNSDAVIYIKDEKGKYVMVNSTYENFLGIDRKNLIDKTDHEIFDVHQADQFTKTDATVLQKLKRIEYEEAVITSQGVRTFRSIKFPVYDEIEKTYFIYGISVDITLMKRFGIS
jgi:PAS domain S-box-containing protein